MTAKIAHEWESLLGYPFKPKGDLARAAQYVALQYDGAFPKDTIAERLESIRPLDCTVHEDPYQILSDLPFPIYITTNYNDALYWALERKKESDPRRVIFKWSPQLQKQLSEAEEVDFSIASAANPIVFHLYGHVNEAETLVLTEDDHLQLLTNILLLKCLPPRIQRTMAQHTLLFLGYRTLDWDLRLLLRIISLFRSRNQNQRTHFAILQIEPADQNVTPEERERVERYFEQYFKQTFDIRVYWGSCHDFIVDLRDRWKEYENER